MSTITLREYQSRAVTQLFEWWSKHQEPDDIPIEVLPTAAGKSIIIAEVVRRMFDQWPDYHPRTLVIVPSKELAEQNAEKLIKLPNKDYFGVSNNLLAGWEEERERIHALAFAIECGLCPDDLQNPADDTRYQEWRITQVITHLLSDIREISAIKKSYFGEAV